VKGGSRRVKRASEKELRPLQRVIVVKKKIREARVTKKATRCVADLPKRDRREEKKRSGSG